MPDIFLVNLEQPTFIVAKISPPCHIDIMSIVDYRSTKFNKTHARKMVLEILARYPGNIRFSGHAKEELAKDNLTTVDAINVLKSSSARIYKEPDWKDGSYRYTVETNLIGVCIAFASETYFVVVSGWRKS